MIKLLGLLMLSVVALAEVEEEISKLEIEREEVLVAPQANINEGNVAISGSANFYDDSYSSGSTSQLNAFLSAKYFVIDRVAMGPLASFSLVSPSVGDSETRLNFGPAVQFFLLEADKIAPYLSANYLFAVGDTGSRQGSATIAIGADYFIYPSVAFGPSLSLTRTFLGTDAMDIEDANTLQLGLNFSIYL